MEKLPTNEGPRLKRVFQAWFPAKYFQFTSKVRASREHKESGDFSEMCGDEGVVGVGLVFQAQN